MDKNITPVKPRLLDQVRERLRYKHYSLSTEKVYVYWIRFFIRWSGLRHPVEMGAPKIEAFLTMLATERQVSASTHKQALSAILFLYKEVIQVDLPWMQQIGRPKTSQRLPVVLTVLEVQAIFAVLNASHPEFALFAKLLYGTGMRVMEAARLRTKDIIFEPRNGSWTSLSVHFFGFPARRDEAQPPRCNEEQRSWGAEKVCNQIRSVITKTVMVKTLT